MLKFIALLLLAGTSQVAFSKTLCLCQIGDNDKVQESFFKAGCKVWLKARTCDAKATVSSWKQIEEKITPEYEGQNVEIGFVGHWASSEQTIETLLYVGLPLFAQRNVDVKIDNTACRAMDDAFAVQKFLNDVKKSGYKNKIEFKGNQVISVGLWDKLLIQDRNLYATASTEFEMPQYPACEEFAGNKCTGIFQKNQTGLCENKDKKLQKLVCKKVQRDAPSPRLSGTKYTRTIWAYEDIYEGYGSYSREDVQAWEDLKAI